MPDLTPLYVKEVSLLRRKAFSSGLVSGWNPVETEEPQTRVSRVAVMHQRRNPPSIFRVCVVADITQDSRPPSPEFPIADSKLGEKVAISR